MASPRIPTVIAEMVSSFIPSSASTLLFARDNATSSVASNATESSHNFMQSYTTGTFLTSFWTNAALACGELCLWFVLRRLIKAVYEPRTYIPLRDEQSSPLGTRIFKPLWKIYEANPEDILTKNGVDPYIFVRFLRLLVRALLPIWIISWTVLFPINSIGGKVDNDLGMFAFGNILDNHRSRYWSHLCLAWAFNGWIMFLIWHEMKEWLIIRQKYLVSKKHSRTAQASTILVTGIPKHYMDEVQLHKLFSYLPGGVKRVWLMRDLVQLPGLWKRRREACAQLERAQVSMIQAAHKCRERVNKKIAWYEKNGRPVPARFLEPANPVQDGEVLSNADRYVPRKYRPMLRLRPSWSPINLGWLGIGKKVDAIEWARQEIARCTVELNDGRDQLARDITMPGIDKEHFAPLSSAFIRFNQQIAAHMARQCLTYNEPYKMENRYIEQSPENVLWSNVSIKRQYWLFLRKVLSYMITVGLVIAFAFPAGYAAMMSRLLTSNLPMFQGTSLPLKVLIAKGLLTSIVPPVLLALVLMIAPLLLRMLARIHRVSSTEVELDVMNRFFVFLLINRFLLVTIVSVTGEGSNASLNFLKWFETAPNANFTQTWSDKFTDTFQNKLPSASNFFITLVMVQFTGTMFNLLQPISLIRYYVRVILGGGTPRNIYTSRYRMNHPDWGTEFPMVTIYFVIMMTYMIISPLINGLGAAFSVMSYFVYKYLSLWVWEQRPQMDTGGAFFPKAVTHVFIGLYLQEICLAALFYAQKGQCLPQFILMIMLICATLTVHYMLWASYSPLVDSLPLSLSHLTYGADKAGAGVSDPKSETSSMHEEEMAAEEAAAIHAGIHPPPGILYQLASETDIRCMSPIASERLSDEKTRVSDEKKRLSEDKLLLDIGSDDQPPEYIVNPDGVTVLVRAASSASAATTLSPLSRPRKPRGAARPARSNSLDWRDVHWCDRTHQWKLTWGRSGMSDMLEAAAMAAAAANSPNSPQLSPVRESPRGSASPTREQSQSPIQSPIRDSLSLARPSEDVVGAEKMADGEDEDLEKTYFAKPGGPGVAGPPRDDGSDPAAFFHPATKEQQPIIWLPLDEFGIGQEMTVDNIAVGVLSTTRNAVFDHRGRVKVTGPAPDFL